MAKDVKENSERLQKRVNEVRFSVGEIHRLSPVRNSRR